MIYMNHNKVANFMSANGSGDHKMKRDILLSEIAKIIVGNPRLVVFHLRESGFKIENNPSNSTLVTVVSNALNKSKKFATKMAHEILGSNYGATGTVTAVADLTNSTTTDVKPAMSSLPDAATSPAPQVQSSPATSSTIQTDPTLSKPTTSSQSSPTPTEAITAVKPAPTAPQVLVLPIVSGLGTVFGGTPEVFKTSSTGGGGGGGSSEGAPADATADLKAKTDALTDVDGSIRRRKKILGFSFLFIIIAGSTYYYYTHNK
jgi:hypothetical protein